MKQGVVKDYIHFIRKLRSQGEDVQIIFVTGLTEYALEGYDVDAVSARGNHGLGMKRVKAAVDKYQGYLNLANELEIFAEEVTMPLA